MKKIRLVFNKSEHLEKPIILPHSSFMKFEVFLKKMNEEKEDKQLNFIQNLLRCSNFRNMKFSIVFITHLRKIQKNSR